MRKNKLMKLQKKGQANIDNKISYLIGALIVVVMATAIAPTMFENVGNLTGNESVAPSWVPTVLFVIVGAGIVFLIWRAFNGK